MIINFKLQTFGVVESRFYDGVTLYSFDTYKDFFACKCLCVWDVPDPIKCVIGRCAWLT